MSRSFRKWLTRRFSPTRPIRRPSRLRVEALEDRTVPAGTWEALTNVAVTTDQTGAVDHSGLSTMVLLTNGQVLAHGFDGPNNASSQWYLLTPDAAGNYHDGTWSAARSMTIGRYAFPSNVLTSGKLLVVGGETSTQGGGATSTAEAYDPVTNHWTPARSFDPPLTGSPPGPGPAFADDPTILLRNGQILAGYIGAPGFPDLNGPTYLYDPNTDQWTRTGDKLRHDQSDEENWVLLPDGSVLSYDVWTSYNGNVFAAQRYIPAGNPLPGGGTSGGQWVDASADDGSNPSILTTTGIYGAELGPPVRLPDGRIWVPGASGHTAFYNPTVDMWSAGPDLPTDPAIPGGTDLLRAADDPAAVLPNGKVLIALAPPTFIFGPTYLYEFDPNNPTTPFTRLDNASGFPTALASALQGAPEFATHMLVVPNGHVLFSISGNDFPVWEYTPDGDPATIPSDWRPHNLHDLTLGTDGSYTLHGQRLTGISEGATFGDDAEMSTNYPIIKLLNKGTGDVSYARSFNWTPGVNDDGDNTVDFTLPYNLPRGTYCVTVVASGISSDLGQALLLDWGGPIYADSSWAGMSGTIPDADPAAPGPQQATIGVDAFASVNDAIAAALAADAVLGGAAVAVIVNGDLGPTNSGMFGESVTMESPVPVYLQHGGIAFGSLTYDGNDMNAADAKITMNDSALTVGDDGNTTEYKGVFIGNRVLTKKGAGTFSLSHDESPTYLGDVTIDGGAVRLANSKALFNNTVTVNTVDGLEFGSLTVATVGNLANSTGTGRVNLGTTALTVGGNNADTQYAGVFRADPVTPGPITKVGIGTWTLSGDNTLYAGGVTITTGSIKVGHRFALAISTVTVDGNNLQAGLTFASGLTTATLGGLSGGKDVSYGGIALTIGGNGASTTYTGSLTGTGSLKKAGTGTLTLTGNDSAPAGTAVSGGRLIVSAGLSTDAGLAVDAGAALGGGQTSQINTVSGPVAVAGTIRGGGDDGPGRMFISGDLSLSSTATFAARLYGLALGTSYDYVYVSGAVNLGSAHLALDNQTWPTSGTLMILEKAGDASTTGLITGRFVGLPEGAIVYMGGQPYMISYVGGDGNDVTLTPQPTNVVSIQVNDGSAQRSEVRSLTVTFAQAVAFATSNAAAAFTLRRVGDGAQVILAQATAGTNAAGHTVVTLTFTNANPAAIDQVSTQNGGPPSLADGVYQLTIDHTAVSVNNQPFNPVDYVSPVDGTGWDAPPNTLDYHFGLYRLFGDATGNGTVDLIDLAYFRSTFNAGVGDPLFLAYMDANNIGGIDLLDLAQFRTRFNVSLF